MPNWVFPLVIVTTTAIAFLPMPYRFGWTRGIARVVQIPLRPFMHLGNVAAGWIEPAPTVAKQTGLTSDDETLAMLVRERNDARHELAAAELKIRRMQREIEALQLIPPDVRQRGEVVAIAQFTRRSMNSPRGTVELTVSRGESRLIPVNCVAVYEGVYLIGRTVEHDDGLGTSVLLPLINKATGYIRTRVQPATERTRVDASGMTESIGLTEIVAIEPVGDGTFTGVVDRRENVREGDFVLLDDSRWPQSAQALIVGRIEDVVVDDDEPLRDRLTVRPEFQVNQLSEATLVADPIEVGTTNGGGGGS